MKKPKVFKNKKYYYVYKVTYHKTGQYYIGSRSCNVDPANDQNYKGSQATWKISKNEKKLLVKEIIKYDFKNREESIEFEANLISQHIQDPFNENYYIPSKNFGHENKVTVKNTHGKVFLVSKDDPRYLSGELKFIHCEKVSVIDSKGTYLLVSKDDPRYLSGELKFIHCEKVDVIDENGIKSRISNKDPRYLSGELKSVFKNTVLVYDEHGNKFRTSINDPRYLSGELKFIACGKSMVKDKNGKFFYVDKNDPRIITGELVGGSKGYWSQATHLIINEEFNSVLYFSKKYGVNVKDLKEYLEKNNIAYIKKTTASYYSEKNKIVSTSKSWAWNLKIKINDIINTTKFFSKLYKVKVSHLKKYLDDHNLEYNVISKTKK